MASINHRRVTRRASAHVLAGQRPLNPSPATARSGTDAASRDGVSCAADHGDTEPSRVIFDLAGDLPNGIVRSIGFWLNRHERGGTLKSLSRRFYGLVAAAACGRQGGRRPVVTTGKLELARALLAQGLNVREAATRLNIGKTALYDTLASAKPL
jgi:hypothetical protein